jgi:lambda family phage portal protein
MSIFDRLAQRWGYVSQTKVDEERRQRQAYSRRFAAAKVDRLTSSFVSADSPIDYDLVTGYETLLGRARDLAKNDDYIRRFLKLCKTNIVGPRGISLVGQLRTQSGEVDHVGNDALESAWRGWGQIGSPEVSGKLSWVGCQNMYTEALARDGEVLVLKHPNFQGNDCRFAIQFLDPLLLDPRLNETTASGNEIIMSVEVNPKTRRPVAYWLRVEATIQPVGGITFSGGKEYRRIPAHMVIHRFNQEYCTQTRGFTPMVSGIARLNHLGGYEEAEVVRKRASSALMGFYTQEGDGEFLGDDKDGAGNLIQEFEPGIMEKLPSGVHVEWNNPVPNSTDYAVFIKACLRGIASGLGISYNTISNDLEGVNFSSIRTGVLEDRESWKCLQECMIEEFIAPVFAEWLKCASLAGAIRIKGQAISPDKAMDRFSAVTWQPRRWSWVDPVKDANASLMLIKANIRSTSDVIRETGKDPDEVFAEIAREKEKMKELGISPAEVVTALADEPDEE